MTSSEPSLPDWHSVLAVVAHPDDESFGLGALLTAFVARQVSASVLCFTHGEASTLHGVDGDLAVIREQELRAAAAELGLTDVQLTSHPDGALSQVGIALLKDEIAVAIDQSNAEGLLVFDPSGITGHPDHQRATEAAVEVALERGIGVLGWTLPDVVARQLREEFGAPFVGHDEADVDLIVSIDRAAQLRAVACHPSQATPGSVLWRRLELLGSHEHLRWLVVPAGAAPAR
ncbi:MAG: PIG-L deacetylase family protein [Candidatus Nanopelagicales bacterium]